MVVLVQNHNFDTRIYDEMWLKLVKKMYSFDRFSVIFKMAPSQAWFVYQQSDDNRQISSQKRLLQLPPVDNLKKETRGHHLKQKCKLEHEK